MLHPDSASAWARYLEAAGADALEDVTSFKAAIHRERFPHLFPPPIFTHEFAGELATVAQRLLDLLYSLPDRIFGGDERRLIERYVPRTFRITPADVDTLLAAKDDYVLKPTSEYGGRGILFGDQTPVASWTETVRAVAAGGDYVAQRRLAELWRYPGFDGAGHRDYHVVLGPLMFGGAYGGTLVRWTDVEGRNLLINVRNGAEAGALLSA
ncbi:MAG TPA: hypothetical protein VN408_23150 [Actinoplanes sp.]|nr:hypothetical protein [Actinoplanes sp.]